MSRSVCQPLHHGCGSRFLVGKKQVLWERENVIQTLDCTVEILFYFILFHFEFGIYVGDSERPNRIRPLFFLTGNQAMFLDSKKFANEIMNNLDFM